jgi:hypothetical protein
VATHQLAVSIITAKSENSWLYLEPVELLIQSLAEDAIVTTYALKCKPWGVFLA